jgi:hypothetical protein
MSSEADTFLVSELPVGSSGQAATMEASRIVRLARGLILVSLALGLLVAIAALVVIVLGATGRLVVPALSITGAVLVLALKTTGLVLGATAFRRLREGRLRDAGVLALIAAFFPPFDLLALCAGLLILVGGGTTVPPAAPGPGEPKSEGTGTA